MNKKSVISHIINETPLKFIKNRDMVDKRFKFNHNGSTYVYCSSVPDEIVPVDKLMERLNLIMTICKYTFGSTLSGGKFINVELIGQTDFNLGSGAMAKSLKALLATAIPG